LSDLLKTTPLHPAHLAAGARMVAFAGYDMPVQYRDGVLKEHLWTRAHAGVFDVSHMGPAWLALNEPSGEEAADHAALAAIVAPLISGDFAAVKPGRLLYSLLLNPEGGILDDLMIGRWSGSVGQSAAYIVVNAGTKEADFARIEQAAAGKATLTRLDDGALIAVQGPQAAEIVVAILPEAASLGFMRFGEMPFEASRAIVSRSGYTGEDGFEILVPPAAAESLWRRLLTDERVRPIGLGARDSLRLEAGLPLYGHDLDETTSPIEAGLGFAVSKRRLKAGDLAGAGRMAREWAGDLNRVRVGLMVLDGAPAREGAEIATLDGAVVGRVTSGGFSPSLGVPIAMGFVPPALSAPATRLSVIVRGKHQPAAVTALPFVSHRYVRAP
jgi:aminomethyltransferase